MGYSTLISSLLNVHKIKLYSRFRKKSLTVPQLNIEIPYDPIIPLLAICPIEFKMFAPTYTYTQVFIAASFRIAEIRQTTRSPSADEWINKMEYNHTMEY